MNDKESTMAERRVEPGALRSEAFLEIQTRQAQRLVHGRESGNDKAPAIIGLLSFGRRMRQLWLSAQFDDPYADWYLLKIEQAIEASRAYMAEKQNVLMQVLDGISGVKIDVAHSLEPIRVSLQFSNPYGYMGAYLIADYDALMRAVLTARHFALIDRDKSQNIIQSAGRGIRHTFNLAAVWRYTGVTREDLRQMNQAAQRARDLMGKLPETILDATCRARVAPNLRRNATSIDPVAQGAEKLGLTEQALIVAKVKQRRKPPSGESKETASSH
ncbi:PFL_4669 family integrating conjugative element protein [Methylocaldum sp. 14B]|jgi:integrating conjugative element protein (TIGR03761 family)|uniref:PFL_4669 family integrating conjugative element protein n=1 Tax=Methylocaldum sp. 14B TaxID=1912213 RepID=UPI00098AA593|nr:TIGR03761 family integrating conjugative element protein [Methylocaldum sp. 14B]